MYPEFGRMRTGRTTGSAVGAAMTDTCRLRRAWQLGLKSEIAPGHDTRATRIRDALHLGTSASVCSNEPKRQQYLHLTRSQSDGVTAHERLTGAKVGLRVGGNDTADASA
jgi:hypothetical protein